MDANDRDLIEQLLARAGAIMEDASVIALVAEDRSLAGRIAGLEQAAADITALVGAARCLLERGSSSPEQG